MGTSQRMNNLIITGSGRSGTSLLAGLFGNAGYFMGDDLYPPRQSNPKGFFESHDVNGLNEAIIRRALTERRAPAQHRELARQYGEGHLWLLNAPLRFRPRAGRDERESIRRLVSREPFCFKDPRFAFTLADWLEEAPGCKVLCAFREPGIVLNSIIDEWRREPYLATLRLSVRDIVDGWCRIYLRMLAAWREGAPVWFVEYRSIFNGHTLDAIADTADAPLNRHFPTPKLARSESALVSPEARRVFGLLKSIEAAWLGGASPDSFVDEVDRLLVGAA